MIAKAKGLIISERFARLENRVCWILTGFAAGVGITIFFTDVEDWTPYFVTACTILMLAEIPGTLRYWAWPKEERRSLSTHGIPFAPLVIGFCLILYLDFSWMNGYVFATLLLAGPALLAYLSVKRFTQTIRSREATDPKGEEQRENNIS